MENNQPKPVVKQETAAASKEERPPQRRPKRRSRSADAKLESNSVLVHVNTKTELSTSPLLSPEKVPRSAVGTILSPERRPVSTITTKPKKTSKKKDPLANNAKITAYFPVRRSDRKTEKERKLERELQLKSMVLEAREDGLEVHKFPGKGRGVIATREFLRGEFVVEYKGELIELSTAREREELYERDQNVGCYMYYFMHKNKHYCVDATPETEYKGRLVNHSAKRPNLTTRAVEFDGVPYLLLMAARDIRVGEELLYDYGDHCRETIEANPWLVDS